MSFEYVDMLGRTGVRIWDIGRHDELQGDTMAEDAWRRCSVLEWLSGQKFAGEEDVATSGPKKKKTAWMNTEDRRGNGGFKESFA